MLDKLLNMLPIVNCQEATRLASLSMERKLTLKELIDLRVHTMLCSLCVQFEKQIKGLRTILHDYKPQRERSLPDTAKEQIKKALETNL